MADFYAHATEKYLGKIRSPINKLLLHLTINNKQQYCANLIYLVRRKEVFVARITSDVAF